MYTYTPQENIEQAKLRIGDISLQDYINSANAIIQSSNTNRVEEQSSSPNYSTAQVVGDTLGMVAKDVFNGLSKAFEGIADFGAGLVGSIAKWAGNESVEQAMADYVARDTTNEYVWNGMFKGTNQDFEASAINKMSETGQNIVRGVAQGVGGMIPTIAISLISRGAGASAGAASIASLTQMGISAAGTATEEALNDEVYDANGNRVNVQLDRAFLYGLASGCMEIATETIIGGAYEGIFGKGLLDGVVKNLTKSVKFGKLVGWLVNNLGEGVEEIVSAVFEDTLKTIYNSPDGKMHWKAPELQNVIESGIIGSLTSVVMGTSSQVLSRVSSKNTIGQSLQNISENNEWASNLQEKGRYDEKRATSVSQDNEKQLNTIEKRLKIMSDVKRARIMTQMPQLFNYFNNDGTRIAKQQLDSGVSLAENIEVGRQNGTFDARITDDNKVSNTLAKAEARLEGKEHLSIATNVDTDEQKNNLKVVKKLTDPIGRASGVPLKIVVFQSDVKDSQVNGFISGDTMYVNKDKLNNLSDIAKVWSHESLGHFTENTKEHSILIGQLKGAYEEMYNKVKDYIENRSNYQESEWKSETEAHFIEAVFGGLDIIDESGKQVHLEADITNDLRDRIIAENSGAFKKLANRIKWIVEKLKATFTGDKKTLEYIERLDNIAKTIDSALAKGGTKVIADKVEKAADTILTSDRANRRIIAKIERIAKEYGIDLNASSRVINSINNRGIPTEYSLATWQENVIRVYDKPNKRIVMKSGRDILIEQLKNNGVSQEDIDKIVGAVDNVADIVLSLSEKFSSIKKFLNAKPYYRDDGSLMLSAIVSNGEYELNIDFTTICKKREQLSLFLQEYAELCQKEPEKYNWGKQGGFTNQAIEVLNNLFRKYDLDTACTMCFVEAKRQYFNDWANKIVMYWNAALKEKGITKVKPISKVEGLEKIDTLYGIKGEITEETMDKVGLEFSSDINRELAEQMAEEEKEKTYFKRMLQYIELNKTDPENHPLYLITKDDLLNSKVIAYLRSKAKDFYSFLLTAYGTANPKMMLPATPYASDLLNKNITYSTGGKPVLDAEIKRTRKAPEVKRDVTSFTADYIFGLGGARANSFSDFQISRVLDYVQFLADCSAKGFAVQTYTKELAMVELFGKTGIKGNISVVFEVDKKYMESFASEEEARDYAGLDKDGNYIVSIDSDKGYFEKADKLQNQEGIKGNWGIVGVGISKYHILKMLDDSRFKMIIPYHSSGMPLHLKVFYNHTYYKDYTDYQTTATADGKSISKDNPLKVKNGKTYKSDPFLDIFYKTYRETNGNYIAATQSYLDFCKEYNLRPRFTFEWDSNKTFEENIHSDGNYITNHPNYYKVLIDFTSDGGLDKDGKQIFKKQEAIDIKNAFDGVDIAGIIVEEATKLEQQYEKYNRAKQGIDKDGNKGDPIFELFCKALQGDLNDEDLKQIRDDRIEKENKENKVKSQNDIKASLKPNISFSFNIDNKVYNATGEETSNLVAIHNLRESELLKVLELGGFPMPSIAVTKADIPHDNYGDITIVFDKDTIDPQKNAKNVVYDKDAWTPVIPSVDIKLSKDKANDISHEIYSLVEQYPEYRTGGWFENQYKNYAGEYVVPERDFDADTMVYNAKKDVPTIAAYLSTKKNKDIKPLYKEKYYNTHGMSYVSRTEAGEILKAVGIDRTTDVGMDSSEKRKLLEKYIEYKAKEQYEMVKNHVKDANYDNILKFYKDKYGLEKINDLLMMSKNYYEDADSKEYDLYATKDKLTAQIDDENDFKRWIWAKIEKAFEKKGIRNDADPYTRAGYYKKFESLHNEYNLENIVKQMSKGEQAGATGLFMTSDRLAAKLSKQFKSIKDIRESQDLLKRVSEEEEKAFKKKTYEMFSEILNDIDGKNPRDVQDALYRKDGISDMIGEMASARPITIDSIKRTYENYTKGYDLHYNFNDTIANKILTLFQLLQKTPTTYFEAKPRRAIGFNEIRMVLVPEDVSNKLINKLEENNIPYNKYNGQDGERSRIIQKMDDIQFSFSNQTDSNGNLLTNGQVEFFKKSKVRNNDGKLQVLYHGTNGNFTIFDKALSQNAFFFSNNKRVAHSYGDDILPVYLDIRKPYVIDAKDSYWNEIYDKKHPKNILLDKLDKLVNSKATSEEAKKGFPQEAIDLMKKRGWRIEDIDDRTRKEMERYDWFKQSNPKYVVYLSKGNWNYIYANNLSDFLEQYYYDNPSTIIENTRDIVRRIRYIDWETGKLSKRYDGIIIKNLVDYGKYGGWNYRSADIYIAFEPNQIKLTTNENPTEDDDIRFSLNPKERLDVIKTKDDIKQVVQSIFMDDDSGNPIVTYIAEEDNSEITRKILKEAPYVPENMVETFADEIAKNIIEKATYDKYFYEDDIDIQQLKQYKKNAARYRHKIRFSDSDKAELIHRYDRKGAANVLRFYSKKDGGLYLDQLIEDMYEDIGVQMPENESTIDLFFGWINEVDNISNQIDRATSEHRGQYTIDSLRLPYEKVEMIKDQIRERLVSVLEPYVANHQIERDNILEEERERLKAEYDKKVKANEMKLADAKKQMEEELAKRKIELDKQREQEVDNQVLQQTKKVVMEANRMVNESEAKLDKIKQENAEMKKRFKLLRKVTNKARWFRKENMKEFNKSSLQDEGIEQAVSGLSKIGNVNYAGGKGARQVVADYIEKFYNPEHRKMIGEQYQDDLYDDLKQIADNRFRKTKTGKTFKNNKDLSLEEIGVIQKMLLNAESIVKNYNQVKINKKYEKLDVKVKESLEIMKKFAPMLSDAKVIRAMRHLMAEAIEPRVVIKMLFGMQDNILSDLYEDIARGETKGKALQLHLDQMLQAFYKEHKKYGKTLSKIVMFRGQKMTKAQLLTLVKYYEQDHSKAAVLNTGWAITNEKTGLTEKVSGFIDSSKLLTQEEIDKLDADTLEELKEKRKAEQEKQAAKEMYDLLTEEDKQYLEKISDIMEEAAKMQIQTDIEFKGYSDINPETSRKYLPIKRYGGDFAVDSFKAVLDSMKVDQAGNQSISKARTRNQRHLQLFDIDTLVLNYAKQLGVYYGLAVPIKEFQRAYNFNVTDNINKPVSIRNTISEDVWDYAGKYITKLLGDIQGFDRGTSAGSRALSKLRSGYVTASLGLNIKVMLTQFASYPTAFSILRASSLAKAFTKKISFKEMDKYSDYANVRNALDDAAKSQGADGGFNGKLGNLAKASMWGIGKVDRFTIGMLWNACQFEIEARHKGDATYKFGTEENKKEAAILLEDVGRKTQPNYTTTERTGIQRSSSELVRWTLGSFTSVPSRMLSRLVETSMELRALWYRQHKLGESVSVEERRAIGTKFVKSVTAVTMSNLMYVLIAQALKFAFDKDRKDKEGNEIDWWEDMLIDFGSVNVGMIPFFKDLYSSFVQGYSYDGSTFSTGIISDLFAIGEDAMDMVTKSANGKATSTNTIMGWIKKMGDALGTLFGIPTRNVYNQLYGIIKRFVPSAAYQMNSIFYSTSKYSQDLRKAIEDGDTDLANTIMGLMLKEKGISRISDKATDKIRELYAKGYNILPRTIGDSVTIDGEEYGLSATQQQKIKSVYDQANSEVEKLIADNGFNRLDEKIQAKTIKWIYDYYYEYAVANTLGLTADSKKLLYGETMSVSRFALAISVCGAIAPDKDRKGSNIAGTKKNKIIRTLRNVGMTQAEREMILAYLGYSVDESIISRYIRSLGLTRNQQTIFKSYMSFAA